MKADKYLRVKQVCELTGLSRATIYALEKNIEFPKKIALGARAVAWRESDILTWLESRKDAHKLGREARPGRPPVAKLRIEKVASATQSAQLPDEPLPLVAIPVPAALSANKQSPSADDWSDSEYQPSQDELDSIQFDMVLRASKTQAPNQQPVKRPPRVVDLVSEFNAPAAPSRRRGKQITLSNVLKTTRKD